MGSFKTEQEGFWAGDFGNEYIERNKNKQLVASNIMMFAKMLEKAHGVKSIIEFGSNIGLNLQALHHLLPDAKLSAIEINSTAATILKENGFVQVYNTSILDFIPDTARDLTFTKGVLIHINPDVLPLVYDKLYQTSSKYIMMTEYYDPNPVEISYRGHEGKLFKRDFAGELMERFPDVKLVDYGFFYHNDPRHDQEDMNWFLMEKNG